MTEGIEDCVQHILQQSFDNVDSLEDLEIHILNMILLALNMILLILQIGFILT